MSDRRAPLTTADAERGVVPVPLTRVEWRRMADDAQAYHDRLVLESLMRAKLGT